MYRKKRSRPKFGDVFSVFCILLVKRKKFLRNVPLFQKKKASRRQAGISRRFGGKLSYPWFEISPKDQWIYHKYQNFILTQISVNSSPIIKIENVVLLTRSARRKGWYYSHHQLQLRSRTHLRTKNGCAWVRNSSSSLNMKPHESRNLFGRAQIRFKPVSTGWIHIIAKLPIESDVAVRLHLPLIEYIFYGHFKISWRP